MSLSTNLVAGLSSGFDWRTMIDELIGIQHRRVDLVEDKKSDYEAQLSEWQSFNTKLLAVKTAAEGLKDPKDFYLYHKHVLEQQHSASLKLAFGFNNYLCISGYLQHRNRRIGNSPETFLQGVFHLR
jgi:flagellar capping protein FliD